MAQLSDRNLAGLLAVRNHLARFQRTSDREARGLGTTHAQQHVLLALRGHRDPGGPTVKDVATALGVASPSAVELIARMVGAKLIERHPAATDPARRTADAPAQPGPPAPAAGPGHPSRGTPDRLN